MVKITEENLSSVLDRFRPLIESEDSDAYNALKELTKEYIELPEFASHFHAKRPLYTITGGKNSFGGFQATIDDPDGFPVGGIYSDLSTPYYFVERTLKGEVIFKGDLSSTGNEPNSEGEYDFVFEENHMLLSGNLDDEALAKYDYMHYLFTVEHYLKNPDDFRASWAFFTHHPTYWSRHKADSDQWNKNYSDFWMDISTYKDGSTCFMFEAGAGVGEERTMHYHDLRLDVYSKTYEDGIIQLAALTHKFFDMHGTEREEVEYEKSELELKLEEASERLEEYIEAQEEKGLE